MASYSVIFKPSLQKDFRRLTPQFLPRVLDRIEGLQADPFPPQASKLSGAERLYRIRVGDYRIVYEVDTARVCGCNENNSGMHCWTIGTIEVTRTVARKSGCGRLKSDQTHFLSLSRFSSRKICFSNARHINWYSASSVGGYDSKWRSALGSA